MAIEDDGQLRGKCEVKYKLFGPLAGTPMLHNRYLNGITYCHGLGRKFSLIHTHARVTMTVRKTFCANRSL